MCVCACVCVRVNPLDLGILANVIRPSTTESHRQVDHGRTSKNSCVIDAVRNELTNRHLPLKHICGTAACYYSSARYEQIMLTMLCKEKPLLFTFHEERGRFQKYPESVRPVTTDRTRAGTQLIRKRHRRRNKRGAIIHYAQLNMTSDTLSITAWL